MDILFTTNDNFWSKFFCFIARESVSHIAFKFDINNHKLIIDCTKPKGRILPFSKFSEKNKTKYIVRIDCDPDLENLIFKRCLNLVGVHYDTGAWIYGIWRGILKLLFKIKLPEINLMSDPLKFACTEIFYPIEDILREEFNISFDDMDLAMQSPYMIYIYLKENENVDKSSKAV